MNVTPTSATTATTATTDATTLGRTRLADNFNMFLTLLTTQMKNQDPTSPMDSTQFMSQLVQMTGVEQQLAGNDLLKQLVANTGSTLSSAVDLIGKQVRATSAAANLSNGQAGWVYNLSADAADLKVEVLDANGRTVHVAALTGADAQAGDHAITWNGRDMTGARVADGTYTLRLTAKDASGGDVPTTTFVQGLVTGVEQSGGKAVITVNGGKVGLDQVTSVALAPAANSTTNATGSTTATGATTSQPADQMSAAAA